MNHSKMKKLSDLFDRAHMSHFLQWNMSCKQPGEWYRKYATKEEKEAAQQMTSKDYQNLRAFK